MVVGLALQTVFPAVADVTSPSITWQVEGTEFELRETAEWGAVVSFEIPDSGGQLALFFYSSDGQGLQEVQVGTELHRVVYDDAGEAVDLVLQGPDNSRALRSRSQETSALPTWLSRDALDGAAYVRVECDSCAMAVGLTCSGVSLVCTICGVVCRLNPLLDIAVRMTCQAISNICTGETDADLDELSACRNLFCCDRSKCGTFGDCYDEGAGKCCEDGSVVDADGCCEEEVIESCCGLEQCGVDPNCYTAGAEKCCEGVQPAAIVPASECCPNEVRAPLVIQKRCSRHKHEIHG